MGVEYKSLFVILPEGGIDSIIIKYHKVYRLHVVMPKYNLVSSVDVLNHSFQCRIFLNTIQQFSYCINIRD